MCINKQDMTVFLTKQFSLNKNKTGSINDTVLQIRHTF